MNSRKELCSKVIGIAGGIGSGKTTLAHSIVEELGYTRISFGSFVRAKALAQSIEPTRENLQNLGEQLIFEMGADTFVAEALELKDRSTPTEFVLDGIRHLSVWNAVLSLCNQHLLVYLNIPEEARLKRIQERDGSERKSLVPMLRHSMELNIAELEGHANLVVTDVDKAIARNTVLGYISREWRT